MGILKPKVEHMESKVSIIGAGLSGLCIGSLLSNEKILVTIHEKMNKVGGRTATTVFKNHVLDNGFHIMPFYKKSFVYEVIRKLGLDSKVKISKISDIHFYSDKTYYKYPKGLLDLLTLSMIDFSSRIELLKTLFPISFYSIKKSETLDNLTLTSLTNKLDSETRSFFDAICMLAFAATPEDISLGEFVRTIIRANPVRGGTSEFGYPTVGGYDYISKSLATFMVEKGSEIILRSSIKKIVINNKKVTGIITSEDKYLEADLCIVSLPAYDALDTLFDPNTLDNKTMNFMNKLHKTTSVIEIHFALSDKIDSRQIVFPVGDSFTVKGIFFISNISPFVSPKGEHLIMAGTPISPKNASNAEYIRSVTKTIKDDIRKMYPRFDDVLLWERPKVWRLVESVAKAPGLVWKQKMPHEVPEIEGLFFVGDSTVSYGIGTDSAAHSALLCYNKIVSYLSGRKD